MVHPKPPPRLPWTPLLISSPIFQDVSRRGSAAGPSLQGQSPPPCGQASRQTFGRQTDRWQAPQPFAQGSLQTSSPRVPSSAPVQAGPHLLLHTCRLSHSRPQPGARSSLDGSPRAACESGCAEALGELEALLPSLLTCQPGAAHPAGARRLAIAQCLSPEA